MRIIKIFKYLKRELILWYEDLLLARLPGKIGMVTRRMYWTRRFKACSSGFLIGRGCIITSPENVCIGEGFIMLHNGCLYAHNNGFIKIGDRVGINSNVILGAADNGNIIIGNDVLIGPNVVIRASNHKYRRKDIPINRQGHTGGRVFIGNDVWIGANVTILPDVSIGSGSVIGAGAVVNKDIPSYSLSGGVPVQVISEKCRI